MKLQVRSTFSFGKLAQYISSGEFARQKNRILGAHIAEASKRFIMQGKVQPRLLNSSLSDVCPTESDLVLSLDILAL